MFDQDQLGLSCVTYHTPTPPATHRVLLVLTQVNWHNQIDFSMSSLGHQVNLSHDQGLVSHLPALLTPNTHVKTSVIRQSLIQGV